MDEPRQTKLNWKVRERIGRGVMNPRGIELEPGYYKHFKGNNYIVEGTATHSETGERMVVYRADYGDRKLFVRPLVMFIEMVEVPHSLPVPRFRPFTEQELQEYVASNMTNIFQTVYNYILGGNDK